MRTPIQGEALVDSLSREGFATLLEAVSAEIDERAADECWKVSSADGRRRGMLELYRSFDPDVLDRYQGSLAKLGVPTLILWGNRTSSSRGVRFNYPPGRCPPSAVRR